MPGISFEAQHPNGAYRMGAQSPSGTSGSGWRVEPNYQSQNNAMPVDPVQIQARTPERPMKPVAQKAPGVDNAAPVVPQTQANTNQENVLAGLPGVAPMPSSLVDEEFVEELIKSLQAAGQYDDAIANKIRAAANKAYAELDAEIEKQ